MITNTSELAMELIGRGMRVIPIPAGTKGPTQSGWPQLNIGIDDVDRYFPDGSNIGLLLGQPYAGGHLADIDLDIIEAVHAADYLLPDTGFIWGRSGKP